MEYKYKKRADLFISTISTELDIYKRKWKLYFYLKDWDWDDDLLSDTIVKCYDTIGRKNLREGNKECWNYLFKALTTNYKRDKQYARNKNRTLVEDINEVYETYLNTKPSADYKIVHDLWIEYQINYIARVVEYNWDKKTFYTFKLKYLLNSDDATIKKKTHNSDWKKDMRSLIKWLKMTVKEEDIVKDFGIHYPDVDLSIIGK